MAELKLYTNPMSRGRIARWMLEEIGKPYDVEILDFGPPMKGPDYCTINPMGKVPALRHGDAVVTEVAAICAYLAMTFPEAGLAPHPNERADFFRWLFFTSGPWKPPCPTMRLALKSPQTSREWSATAITIQWSTHWRKRFRAIHTSLVTASRQLMFMSARTSAGACASARCRPEERSSPIGTD